MNDVSYTSAATGLGDLPQWDLSGLYASQDAAEFAADMEKARQAAAAFADEWRGKLTETAQMADGGERLAQALKAYEALSDLIGRLGAFAFLNYVRNTDDADKVKFFGDSQQALTHISTGLLFFELEFNHIADADIETALKAPELAHYKPWIDDLTKERPYQLSEEIEKLFHEKTLTGASAWNRLFDDTMGALRFEVDGEELTLEPTLTLLLTPDRAKRQAAAEALAKVFKQNIRLFTHVTNTLAKDKEIADRWRGFGDIADSRHLANRVEGEVVAAMVEAVRAAYPRLSHRYYTMKAKWLGLDKLMHWDRNAPLPHEDTREIPWDEARARVLTAYAGFDQQMADIAQRFFDNGWIDAPVKQGKSPGAFAHPTVPSAHPFVMLNYMGKTRDVMTLAHELGHGVHQVLAAGQGALMAPTPLTLAETASVFGEMLTFQSLLADEADTAKRKALLASKVEDMLNTVVRQIAFYCFERDVHTARRHGELTSEQLGEIWMNIQHESLGPAIEFGEGYDVFWSYIPHFIHSPFYVYAYAFGDCLVNSLYARYLESESGFAEKYFELLKAGGTKHHSELLAPFGLNAADPAFWQMGLSMIEGFIDEIEQLEAVV